MKTAKQTFFEFEREKKTLFERWCLFSGITTLDQLQELVLLEDFKSCILENVVVPLNEQRVANLSNAAVVADEFVLTHRTVFPPTHRVSASPSIYQVSDRETTRLFSCIGKGETQSVTSRKRLQMITRWFLLS